MGTINAEWHKAHVLGRNADLDTRVEWHIEHANACSCRQLSPKMRAEIERRGLSERLQDGTKRTS